MPRAKNHLKVLENLSCRNITYHKDIVDATCQKGHDPLLQKFTEKFYAYLPVDYTSNDRLTTFASIAKDTYEFFLHRGDKDKIIDAFSSLQKDESLPQGNSNFIVIKILCDDKPFIVDSLKCLFARSGIRPKFLFHPVMKVVRDNKGKLLSFEKGENGTQESLVYIKIYGNYNEKFVKYISKEIANILDKVESTYESWPTLLTKLDEVSNKIESDPHAHTSANPPSTLESALKETGNEINEFLRWLKSDHFTFLGYTKIEANGKFTDQIGDKEICSAASLVHEQKFTCEAKSEYCMSLGQVNKISPVHKDSFIDYIRIKIGSEEHVFLGLYGSAIYYQSVKNIPVLRQKLKYVLDNSGFIPGGYNAKKLRVIIESLPREALFQMDNDHLYCMCLHILSAMVTKNLKVFVQPDNSGEFVSILIFLPRDRLTPEVHNNINQYLSDQFDSHILSDYITEIEQDFCHLYVTLNLGENITYENIEMDKIEDDLDVISSEWKEALVKELSIQNNPIMEHPETANIFPKDYQQKADIKTAIIDLSYIAKLNSNQSSAFNLQIVDSENYILKIYTHTKQALFNLIPLIENLGFKTIDEQMFELRTMPKATWLYEFNLVAEHIPVDAPVYVKERVEDALMKMHSGILLSDSLCKLVVLESFNWRQVMILKALTRYLHQTGFAYGKGYVQIVLIQHHEYTNKLLELFEAMFDPSKVSIDKAVALEVDMMKYLIKVVSSAEDKVLRSMLDIFKAIVRTNAFIPKIATLGLDASASLGSSLPTNYLSFKFDSSKVPCLPLPIPYAEIFVYSNEFEGVHLRGGKVARGGLRWSDRGEDYRTEVLGLMKAQTTKNTVIVPIGSKGGFFLKFNEDGLTRIEYMARVVECYKTFLRGLLDLTDNIIAGKVVQPKDMVIHDGEDPYLVVAADKGTASFSDYANSVSAEYNFWLGDAFASGGSAGYDHKKMAITSRGAWISVTNHFASMGVDVQKDPITIVGIGDMSGDVFGNGLLRSDSVKLIAAFNHMHIFIDPDPHPRISFEERKRLFDMPGSKWSDYDINLISKGGGIFERSAKRIILTPEIQVMLGTTASEIAPEVLINMLLKAKVDLLWNGGIGTYIKVTEESHLDIGDKANDNLRCNGKDVGAKVVGEGGNLGVSQRGRIEYSKKGGRINTDFIDNSGGVDCSDHEVNIKIAVGQTIARGKLKLGERNILLAGMTDQVAALVLSDNFKQNQALNITEKSSAFTVEMFSRLIDSLEESGLLDRDVEFLPTMMELSRRTAAGEKMTRPELAVLLSYSKMSVYDELLRTEVLTDKYFERDLINYFPPMMQQDFRSDILSHPLRKEIIATIITNKIVNTLSGPLIDTIRRETGAQLCDIVRSYFVVSEIFDLTNLWDQVEKLSGYISADIQIEMFTELGKIMRRGISWFVRNLDHPIDIESAIKEYSAPTQEINKAIGDVLLGSAKEKLDARTAYFANNKVDPGFAKSVAMLDCYVSSFDILIVARGTKAKNSDVARLYFEVSEKFNVDYLRKCCEKQINESYWNRLSVQALKDDLYDKQRRLLQKIIADADSKMSVEKWYEKHKKHAIIFMDFIEDLKLQENIDINMMILANKKFEIFLRKV